MISKTYNKTFFLYRNSLLKISDKKLREKLIRHKTPKEIKTTVNVAPKTAKTDDTNNLTHQPHHTNWQNTKQ